LTPSVAEVTILETSYLRGFTVDRRRFLSTSAAIAAGGSLLSLGGCSKASANTVKIVSSMPRTGSAQGQTDTIVNGARMAIDEYGGEVAGFKIKFEDKDDATAAQGSWDAGREADNAREAAADPDVMVFIGPYNSGASKISQPILNEAGLLQISPACTSVELTKKVPGDTSGQPDIYRRSGKLTYCRVCPNDTVQGPLSAVFAKEYVKAKSVFILDDKELYGRGLSNLFGRKCQELGIQVLGQESIIPTQQNFKSIITSIAEKKPDLLYFGGTSQSGGPQIALDMKGILNCPLLVPDGCYEIAFIKAAGPELFKSVKCYATIGGTDVSELKGAGAEFVKNYKAKYHKDPEAYAIYGYEAAKVFLEALKSVGKKDREEIRKAVLATKDFDKGALGKWSFDADGDTTLMALTVSEVVGDNFKPVRSITG